MNRTSKLLAAGSFALGLALPALAHADHAPNHVHMVKTPTCGCCQVWADRLKQMGLPVTVSQNADYIAMKDEAGVPQTAYACHTSHMGRYVLEGHVPPAAIAKLLAERPDVDGIGVPGMPMGSLGMGYDPDASYEVVSWTDGEVATEPFLVTGAPAEAK